MQVRNPVRRPLSLLGGRCTFSVEGAEVGQSLLFVLLQIDRRCFKKDSTVPFFFKDVTKAGKAGTEPHMCPTVISTTLCECQSATA
jgi:hypothetical protein